MCLFPSALVQTFSAWYCTPMDSGSLFLQILAVATNLFSSENVTVVCVIRNLTRLFINIEGSTVSYHFWVNYPFNRIEQVPSLLANCEQYFH